MTKWCRHLHIFPMHFAEDRESSRTPQYDSTNVTVYIWSACMHRPTLLGKYENQDTYLKAVGVETWLQKNCSLCTNFFWSLPVGLPSCTKALKNQKLIKSSATLCCVAVLLLVRSYKGLSQASGLFFPRQLPQNQHTSCGVFDRYTF